MEIREYEAEQSWSMHKLTLSVGGLNNIIRVLFGAKLEVDNLSRVRPIVIPTSRGGRESDLGRVQSVLDTHFYIFDALISRPKSFGFENFRPRFSPIGTNWSRILYVS